MRTILPNVRRGHVVTRHVEVHVGPSERHGREFRGLRGGEGHASPPRWPEDKAVVQ